MGLGLGLIKDERAICEGVALRTERGNRNDQLAALWDREMWTDAYIPAWKQLDTDDATARTMKQNISYERHLAITELKRAIQLVYPQHLKCPIPSVG